MSEKDNQKFLDAFLTISTLTAKKEGDISRIIAENIDVLTKAVSDLQEHAPDGFLEAAGRISAYARENKTQIINPTDIAKELQIPEDVVKLVVTNATEKLKHKIIVKGASNSVH